MYKNNSLQVILEEALSGSINTPDRHIYIYKGVHVYTHTTSFVISGREEGTDNQLVIDF